MPDAPFVRKAPFLPFAMMLLLMAGCGKSPEARLAGKWVGDRIDNVSADQVARATGWVKGTTLEFAGDKVTVTLPGESPRKGTYKVSRTEGDKLVLSVARPDTLTFDEAKLTMHDHKTMSWDIGHGREVLLVRPGL
jgi:hypothetical protein